MDSQLFRHPKICFAVLIACALAVPAIAQDNDLMPQPANLTWGDGRLEINGDFRVALAGYQEGRLEAAALRLITRLGKQTGIPFCDALASDPDKAALVIHCDHASEPVQMPGEDESYELEVNSTQARLSAANPLGVLRGMETFLQLVELDEQGFRAPAVRIEDHPRFAWRGLMIDSARHWMPPAVIKRNLDGMAALKLNVLHWHLADDQGFRVESKKFPRLQEMGSDGHYYTQEQVREVIAHARERGIRVVPEFDMPGHTTAWVVGYPELASVPGPYSIERKWGVFDPTLDPTREEVYRFIDGFIGEMAALFPDAYFHVGGDEVNGKQWDANPRIQAFRREHGLKNNHELQTYYTRRVQAIVRKHGKKMIGWDEVLRPDLPNDIVIQSWRGQKSLAEAARQGYRGILSAGYYLDLMHSAASHYAVDPLEGATAGLSPEEQARILGGEACMWSEYVTPENVDSRIWPRMAAIAERLWSPQSVKDVDSMYRRLEVISRNLEWLGLTHRTSFPQMLGRLVGEPPPASLQMLSGLLEPVKEYARGKTGQYTSFTPLNRLVDATRPESDVAREFAKLVDNISTNRQQIRKHLTHWSDSQEKLVPLLQRSLLAREGVPLAEDIAALSKAGLEALDYIEAGKHAPEGWFSEQQALLDRAAKPRAELLIMIVPSIRKLVEAAQ
jgi:hexosaminidase